MQKKIIIFVIFLFATIFSFGQDKTNPVLFAEMFGGYSGGSSKGWTGGFTVNYQFKDNLITGRFLGLTGLKREIVQTSPFTFFPVFYRIESIDEYAIMYGKRHIYEGHSFSYSAGLATVDREYLVENDGENNYYKNEYHLGIPFEVNIKWFNNKTERYRVYCLVPVGKPIAFGRSIGFKLMGNVSKTTFVGLGISYGFGWHKTY